MAKDPAFLFYSSDFLVGTYTMSDAQVGKYVRLMCLQHQQGHLSMDVIRTVLGSDADGMIMGKFKTDENGLYYNERLDKEVNRRKDYSESRANNRKTKDTKTHEKDMSNICESYDEHMETETITITNVSKLPNKGVPRGIEKRFDALWELYPRKQGKADALAAYKRAIKDGVDDEQIRCGIEAYIAYIKARNTEEKYIKTGGPFFNQRAWDDDYTVKGNSYESKRDTQQPAKVSRFAHLDGSI